MTETTVQPEVTEPSLREQLLPEGWDKPPEKVQDEPEGKPNGESEEQLAESQEEEQDDKAVEPETGYAERMPINRFIKEAGWELNEAYHNLTVKRPDGTEQTLSQALDETHELKNANEVLLRESQELKEKLNQSATHVPQPNISPEAQALMNQAELYIKALQTTDWSQVDPAQAANQKMDLQLEIQRLQREAQEKQFAYQGELQKKISTAKAEADRQTRARIPEWSDGRVMATDKQAIADMLGGYGLSRQEVETIVDPRVWQMLRDAQRAFMNGKRIEEGAKTVRKVSKTLSAGSRGAPEKKRLTPKQMRQEITKARDKGGREAAQRARLALEFE